MGRERLWYHTARGAPENWFPGGVGVNPSPQTGVRLSSALCMVLFRYSDYNVTPDPPPTPWSLPLVHHRHGLVECFDLLKIILVRWISESGLGTMVPIQTLEPHSFYIGGEHHT